MNQKNNLVLGRAIFTLFIILSLGLIVMNEKGANLFLPKIESKMNDYLENNYENIKSSIINHKITYTNDNHFKMKLSSNQNKNHLFYIKYYKGNITDTYQKDYIEGNNLLKYIEKKLEKEIKESTNIDCKVHSINKLNDYSETVQNQIINEKNLKELKFYYIKKELVIKNFNKEEITNEIKEFIKKLEDNHITPKYYTIIITNKNDITNSIEISHLTNSFLTNDRNEEIIYDIIENKNSELIKENKITVNYLN